MIIKFLNENRFTAFVNGEERTYMVLSRCPLETGMERIIYMDVEDAREGRYEAAVGEIVPRESGWLLRPCAGADPALDSLCRGLMRALRRGEMSPMAFAGAQDDAGETDEDKEPCEENEDGGEASGGEYDPDADQPPEAETPAEVLTPEEQLLRAILGETVSESISDSSADTRRMVLLLGIDPEDEG